MSQFYISSASLPPPPGSLVELTPDQGGVVVPDGAGNINIFGQTSIINNNNGIRTFNGGVSELDVRLTNRLQGSIQTIGAATSAFITFSPSIIGTYAIEVRVSAYNTTGSIGAGYSIFGTVRFDGANCNLCGTPDKIVNEEGAMSAANCTMTVSGANALINGVGYLGQTINWSAVGLYTFVGV